MKKKLLKGSLIAIVLLVATICGLFAYSEKISKIEVIENAKNTISKLVTDATADGETSESGLIEVKDISKPQTIKRVSADREELVEMESLIGRYQFNATGSGVYIAENEIPTNTGFSHIPICAPYEKDYDNFKGNSSAAYLDKSFNENGKIYKAYLVVEANAYSTQLEKAATMPVTLLYGGDNDTEIISGIESTCTYFYYEEWQGTGWIDVTDFVKENGYGWYYGCNIPFLYINSDADNIAAWKLIVIEESEKIPIRKLALSIGNYIMGANGYTVSDLKISGENIFSRMNGTVTGQLLYGVTNVDFARVAQDLAAYSMDGTNFTYITTTNRLRTQNYPFCLVMSRSGIPIKNRVEWNTHYYSMGNRSFTTSNTGNYPELTGGDMELLDIDGTTDNHNVIFENGKKEVTLRIIDTIGTFVAEFLGAAVDIDVPEYTSTQTVVGHDTKYATITGTATNTSTSNDGMGVHDGTLTVKVDNGLKVLSTNAYFLAADGERIDLTEDMYTIDTENNTITYTFGKDSNGKNLNGESLTYTIETECVQGDNVDGKKYTANNEVYANGKLVNNNVETEHYMEKVLWDTSSVTIENPPFDGKTREANYTVEYYKDGEVANTETITETIPELQTELPIDKTKVNVENKYNGYSLERIEIDGETVAELPERIAEGKIIKVYYKLDELVLNTTVNLSAANGHGGVDLDWSTYDAENKIFKAYQKKEGSEEWETISAVDYYAETAEIKVLNVYPVSGFANIPTPPTVTFTYLDGKTEELPKSASLKLWMEGGTVEDESEIFEAYGKNPITEKQMIKVTPVNSSVFNEKPDIIWNYDVVMFGTWDINGGPDSQPNDKALEEIEKYIKAGYGVLAGHDTMVTHGNYLNLGTLKKLRKYFNVDVGYYGGTNITPSMIDLDYYTRWAYTSDKVKVNKTGLITNFPYELPLETILTVPTTDSTAIALKGNVWLEFVEGVEGKAPTYGPLSNYSGSGNPKSYLSTWNNTAVIATGASNCDSTSDERKVLANTLFYLKQRTNATAFTDNSGQDLKAPDKPVITTKGQDGNIVVNYKSEKDNGSTYSYYVESFDDQDSSIKLAKSNERTETVTTGIKGYAYVIDDQETNDFEVSFNRNETNDLVLATEGVTYTEGLEGIATLEATNHGRYIHIKAVDAAGNISEVSDAKLQKLILNTEVNLSAANGHGGVDLDWSTYDPTGKVFKAYQKKEGSEEYESISTIDLYSTEVEPIKVLNVYPVDNSLYPVPTVTFRYTDGTSSNLPKSAVLKVWMEGGTVTQNGKVTTFEAYGKNPITGQQLLEITPVSADEFNENPEMIWNYDMFVSGFWDAAGSKNSLPNDNAISVIEQYIKAGYGVLTGHDSIGLDFYDLGLSKLRKYFNIEIGYHPSVPPSDKNVIDYNTTWFYGSTQIEVSKNGLLTNFPYELPIGTKLTIPFTHTSSQAALGNVWMTMIDGTDNWHNSGSINNYYNIGGTGDPKFYLTTYNNTAMIQAGSTNETGGDPTDDERKVLANTLFYLAQITKATSFTDNSAQDLKSPNVPTAEFEGVKATNDIKLSFNSEDNGSEYSFYVEALDENDTTIAIDTSNTRTETVTTGTKGYYYVIDESSDNNDFEIKRDETGNLLNDVKFVECSEESVEGSINVDLSNNGKYLHVKAVDKAGNISDPATVHIEVKGKVIANLDGGELDKNKGPIEKEGLAGKTEDIGTPTKDGYTFVGWETPNGTTEDSTITYPIGEEQITAKWQINNYKYKVLYYYDGELDESKTVELEAAYNSSVENYEDKVSEGYILQRTENLPLTIGTLEENNVINVYYIADQSKTKDLTYTVEYYKNNEIVEKDTQVVNQTVQVLQPSLLDIDKTQINITDKYRGYTLDKIEIVKEETENEKETVTEIPDTIETGKTIKVYYQSQVEDLVLDTKVNLAAANEHGGVDLDWNTEEHPYDPTDRIFRAFQKKDDEEGAEWESISTVDFYKEIETIKVLNVYPTSGGYGIAPPSTVTYTYNDGKIEKLPYSAMLKVWVEGGKINNETFENYAVNPITGQQIINITPINMTEFNDNPEILWKYDVVMFGIWDINGGEQPTENALPIIEQYIKKGYGVLVGHDAIGWSNYGKGLNTLRKYFNIDIGWDIGQGKPGDISMVDYDTYWQYISTQVKVEKNGLLTNFPYELPVGTILTVPQTHTTSNAAKGTTWMTLVNGRDNPNGWGTIQNYYNAGGTGNPAYYLTAYNNTAMIQAGSTNNSGARATSDERKVLANTLFYLKQRTNATAFTDNSSQDVKAPDKPTIDINGTAGENGNNGNIVVKYRSEKDNGSTYSFRVEAYDDQRADIMLAKSNERTETVTTGIKGYYYVIDDQETNDFELVRDEEGNVTNVTFVECLRENAGSDLEKTLELDSSNHGKYIHIKAIDFAGNISEVETAKLQKLVLDTEVNLGAANGHGGVDLDWAKNGYDSSRKSIQSIPKKR